MKHLTLTIVMLMLAAVATVQAESLTRYELKVGEFSELRVTDGVNVDYRCSADSAGMAVFDAPPSLVSALLLTSSGKKLTVQVATDRLGVTGLPRVTVYSRYLTKALNSGDSTLRVLNVAGCPSFDATLQGNGHLVVRDIDATTVKATSKLGHGTIVITGTCDKASLKTVGAGAIEADGLRAREASVSCHGTGSVGVWASEKLSVFGAGSTTVYYKGTPEIKNRTIGIKMMPIP